MHYKNGRAARVGDLVRGKGYNVKYEIVGLLIAAVPASSSCNCTIAHVGEGAQVVSKGWRNPKGDFAFQNENGEVKVTEVIASIEYGQLDAFVALDPKTGEVLLPEAGPVEHSEPPPPPPDKEEERGG